MKYNLGNFEHQWDAFCCVMSFRNKVGGHHETKEDRELCNKMKSQSQVVDALDKIQECITEGKKDCSQYVLEGVVEACEVTGEKQDADSSVVFYDHTFVDQHTDGDFFYGVQYIPLNGKYLKFSFSA